MTYLTLLVFALIVTPNAGALPQLTCKGDLPLWAIREGQPVRLNPDADPVVVDPRRDAAVYFGGRVEKPWLKLSLTDPLAWVNQREHYQTVTRLKIQTDLTSYFNVRVDAVSGGPGQSVVCDVDALRTQKPRYPSVVAPPTQ